MTRTVPENAEVGTIYVLNPPLMKIKEINYMTQSMKISDVLIPPPTTPQPNPVPPEQPPLPPEPLPYPQEPVPGEAPKPTPVPPAPIPPQA